MSIAINIDLVTEVLLADGWHTVTDDSFNLDSYEYIHGDLYSDRGVTILLGGGTDRLVPATGFTFTDKTGHRISGPLTAVLAVRQKATDPKDNHR